MPGFVLKNTLFYNDGVTKGVCKVTEGHTHIIDMIETNNIVKIMKYGKIGAEVGEVSFGLKSYVSMNFWGFPAENGCAPVYLDVLKQGFVDFFESSNPLKAEYLLSTHIGGLLL